MLFPPLKADRALLWITLQSDAGAPERYAALRAILKACRLHPLDSTPTAALVIVDEAAFRQRLDAARAVLGPYDALHLVTQAGGRLSVLAIGAVTASGSALQESASRPPWLVD